MVHWVLTSINQVDKPKRPFMLGKFISIAKACKDHRNLNAFMQIMSAIEDTIMLRFDGTWEGISHQKYIPILVELRTLYSKKDNFNNLKQEIYKRTDPCVPYLRLYNFLSYSFYFYSFSLLEIYLNEIQDIYKNEPSYLDEKLVNKRPVVVNFKKLKNISRVIAELRRYQIPTYMFIPEPVMQCYLNNIKALNSYELCSLALLSQSREQLLGLDNQNLIPDFGLFFFFFVFYFTK